MKLFGNKPEPSCEYCKNGTLLFNEDDVVCSKYGFIKRKVTCSKFKYNPLKRTPKSANFESDFDESDFSIE